MQKVALRLMLVVVIVLAASAVMAQDATVGLGETVTLEAGASSYTIAFDGTEGDVVSFYAVSQDGEDTRVYIYDADGNELAYDDDGGEGTNPLVFALTIPATGSYTADLQSYSGSNLESAIDVTYEKVDVESLVTDAPMTVTFTDEVDEVMVIADLVAGTSYVVSVSAADTMSSSVYGDIVESGDSYSNTSFSARGTSEFAMLFTPEASGLARVNLSYYTFSDAVEITISVEALSE